MNQNVYMKIPLIQQTCNINIDFHFELPYCIQVPSAPYMYHYEVKYLYVKYKYDKQQHSSSYKSILCNTQQDNSGLGRKGK